MKEKNVQTLRKPMYITLKYDTMLLQTTNFIQSEENTI